MIKKWMYKGNLGVLAVDEQIEELQDYFTQTRPEDFLKFEQIHFGKAQAMINEAKEQSLLSELNAPEEQKIEVIEELEQDETIEELTQEELEQDAFAPAEQKKRGRKPKSK